MTKPGNSNARKGETNRIKWSCWIDTQTLEIIKQLAKLWGKSQGEVIDELAKEQAK